ncbi:hypothetical protein Misp01_74720 [Microtetraspora sp. NBRC 13810]|uniref:serine/threonine-protein kinase n=1 Tax=Microtetraspora sp. NBRC 13810 TaxID=3030990 RepID=UPI0024A44823|nr:serine/threonine-protein kinase [Microtetraspora sp. NBRC 13810]GLW12344.1 hypothetical protein Misp01_74720 [Microtetraspora sp. NBRC 13810]
MFGTPSAWQVPGYTEIRELGAGASGRVVMARHDEDGTLVAIKYLSDELRSDMAFVARFRHEARLLETLNSTRIARLYQYMESGQGAAIVMELIDGVSLRAVLRSQGPTGAETALVVLRGALLGLVTAHRAGIVHRDFKPENVIVGEDGASKLVDFGIAVRAGAGGGAAGTPPYMAPEQWAGAPASPATDVYAATIVFFECLTGSRPFHARNLTVLAHEHQTMPPPLEKIPSPLQGLVERGLAKHPADRPASAEAFLTELEAVALGVYGADWERRGRRRLATLAGLLALQFPKADLLSEADTSLAETFLGGGNDDSPARSARNRLAVRVALGAGVVGVLGLVTALLVSSTQDTELRADTSAIVPTASVAGTPVVPGTSGPATPADETAEPTETATETATGTPTEEPADPAQETAPTATAAAGATSPAAEEPKPKATKKQHDKATKAPTRRPVPRPTRSDEDDSPVTLGPQKPGSPGSGSTPTPPRTTNPQSPRPPQSPDPRPTRTRTQEPPSQTPTPPPQTPTPEPSGTDGPGRTDPPAITSAPGSTPADPPAITADPGREGPPAITDDPGRAEGPAAITDDPGRIEGPDGRSARSHGDRGPGGDGPADGQDRVSRGGTSAGR